MKKFLATLLLAAVMLTGASFCVEYEPAAALEPVAPRSMRLRNRST